MKKDEELKRLINEDVSIRAIVSLVNIEYNTKTNGFSASIIFTDDIVMEIFYRDKVNMFKCRKNNVFKYEYNNDRSISENIIIYYNTALESSYIIDRAQNIIDMELNRMLYGDK